MGSWEPFLTVVGIAVFVLLVYLRVGAADDVADQIWGEDDTGKSVDDQFHAIKVFLGFLLLAFIAYVIYQVFLEYQQRPSSPVHTIQQTPRTSKPISTSTHQPAQAVHGSSNHAAAGHSSDAHTPKARHADSHSAKTHSTGSHSAHRQTQHQRQAQQSERHQR